MGDDVSKHLVSGTCAGVFAKFFEYPFDTVKVRVQIAEAGVYNGYADCATKLFKKEGITGFYRGIAAPTIGAGAENAVCFAGYGCGLRLYDWVHNTNSAKDPIPQQTIFAGAISGIFVAKVLTPVELLKCVMQVEHTLPAEQRRYNGVIDVAKDVWKREGFMGLYKGHQATLVREVPGNAAWFGFYNLAMYMQTPVGTRREELPAWRVALAGGCGGTMYWTAFFPADVVKTKMQLNPEFAKKGFMGGLIHQYTNYGIRQGLYRGWSITAARAFPGNAIIFSVYEMVAAEWDRRFDKNKI